MSSSVDQIKSKLDIVSVLGGYVKLEKSGANFKARCPFHNEKTPSFFVSVDRGTYYCFGCQAKGDIFSFVQEFEGLDFKGALKVLADRAGVTLDHFRPEDKTEKDVLFSLVEQAQFYFEKNLSENKEARKYLQSRGLKEETIKDFHIGFAKEEWRGLHDFLVSKGAAINDLMTAGLIKKKDGGDGYYDTFRSRIIFPIADSSGRVVAFSGRIFPDDPDAPKYLNSPETPIFKKSDILYALDKAKKEIHRLDYSILVEGQMDLVMLHQAGFTNTVASSGTALTESHLVRLQRLSNRLIMAFDGDSAGFKAASRGAQIALSLGMEVKAAAMPEGKDPADMARTDAPGLVETIKNSKHIISFILDSIIKNTPDARSLARKIVSDVLPFVVRIQSASEQGHFVKEINQKTGIKEDALWEDLRKVQNPESITPNREVVPKEVMERTNVILKKLVGIILWQSKKTSADVNIVQLKKDISDIMGFNSLPDFQTDSDALIFEAESYYSGRNTLVDEVSELLDNLKGEKLKEQFTETMILLHKAEVAQDATESTRLLQECQRIAKEMNELKNKVVKQ